MTCTREETTPAASGSDDPGNVVHITASWFPRLRIRLGLLVPRALCSITLDGAIYYEYAPAGLPDCPRCAYLAWWARR